jgi:hypothetical protein
MSISIHAEKAFNKIENHFIIKSLDKLCTEQLIFLYSKGCIWQTHSQHHIQWEETETISLKVRNETKIPLSPLLFNRVLEFLAWAKKQEEIRGIQIDKEEVKLSLCADDMILYLKDPKKTPRHYKQLQQSSRIQNQFTKISSLSTPTMNRLRKNIGK